MELCGCNKYGTFPEEYKTISNCPNVIECQCGQKYLRYQIINEGIEIYIPVRDIQHADTILTSCEPTFISPVFFKSLQKK